jgi:hypothetical protein
VENWLHLFVLALGAARLTILITRDGILDAPRNLIFRWSNPEEDTIVGTIADCPDCCGIWVGLVTYAAYLWQPDATVAVATVLTLALAASLIARKGGYA